MEPQKSLVIPLALTALVSAIIFGGLGWYLGTNNQTGTVTTSATPTPSPVTQTSTSPTATATLTTTPCVASASTNIFDVTNVKVGDKVACMTIKSIAAFGTRQALANDYAKVQFSGETTISGIVENSSSDLGLGCINITDLDTTSLARLPNIKGDDRNGFCLTDDVAKSEFPEGKKYNVTVIVDDYLVDIAPTEVRNSATLVKVVTKKQL